MCLDNFKRLTINLSIFLINFENGMPLCIFEALWLNVEGGGTKGGATFAQVCHLGEE